MIIKCVNNDEFRTFISELMIETETKKEFSEVKVSVDINGDIGL